MKISLINSILFSILLMNSGCASFGKSLKEFLGGDTRVRTETAPENDAEVVGKVDRTKNYKRVDHKTLQEKSHLGADSGSLWMERGQGSYLFSQNTNRLIGDLVNVEIKGHPQQQIETKVNVIHDLIEKIRAQNEARQLASSPGADGAATAEPAPAPAAAGGGDGKGQFNVKIVPARITEILKDGSYFVQGEQPFMIGPREYKLAVQGIVRQEDFNDQGISAETLLDPKFDITTNRGTN